MKHRSLGKRKCTKKTKLKLKKRQGARCSCKTGRRKLKQQGTLCKWKRSGGKQRPRRVRKCRGHRGQQGIPGRHGAQGVQGVPGTQGPPGVQGVQGVTGMQGIQGPGGATGATGPPGSGGITGGIEVNITHSAYRYFYFPPNDLSSTVDLPSSQFLDDEGNASTLFDGVGTNSYTNVFINGMLQEGSLYNITNNLLTLYLDGDKIYAGVPIIIENVEFNTRVIYS